MAAAPVDGSLPRAPAPSAAVLVPVKAFVDAKQRLAETLGVEARRTLAQAMAETVLRAAQPLPVTVVCDHDEVRTWAEARGAEVLWTPGLGLNGAVAAGVAHLARHGFDRAVVAHADLPLADELAWLVDGDGVTLVPDRHGDGTNVACVPSRSGFTFAYGPGSLRAHRAEAARLGLVQRLVADVRLGWDVDLPADLEVPAELDPPAYLTTPVGCA